MRITASLNDGHPQLTPLPRRLHPSPPNPHLLPPLHQWLPPTLLITILPSLHLTSYHFSKIPAKSQPSQTALIQPIQTAINQLRVNHSAVAKRTVQADFVLDEIRTTVGSAQTDDKPHPHQQPGTQLSVEQPQVPPHGHVPHTRKRNKHHNEKLGSALHQKLLRQSSSQIGNLQSQNLSQVLAMSHFQQMYRWVLNLSI